MNEYHKNVVYRSSRMNQWSLRINSELTRPQEWTIIISMLAEKMNRTQVIIAKKDNLDLSDVEYWNHATVEEKLQTITFLRECFYGEEASTGRLQRVHTILKLK